MGTAAEHRKALIAALEPAARRHSLHRVFADANEASALALSNTMDLIQYDKREARYLELVKGYEKPEVEAFTHAFAELVNALEAEIHDALGAAFHAMELHNQYAGQFFTPFHLAMLMAQITCTEVEPLIKERGYFTVQEPAVGAGAMVIAVAAALKEKGINYQQVMHVTAVDIDIRCVHMAYVQFSLLHIPAVVIHGNSLSLETWSVWRTPAHILGFWDNKLRRDRVTSGTTLPVLPQPVSASAAPKQAPSQRTFF